MSAITRRSGLVIRARRLQQRLADQALPFLLQGCASAFMCCYMVQELISPRLPCWLDVGVLYRLFVRLCSTQVIVHALTLPIIPCFAVLADRNVFVWVLALIPRVLNASEYHIRNA